MAQHDYIISNQTFPNTRADLNDVLQAIATCNKGSSAPTTQYAGQMWIDDSAGTTWSLYLYDGSDNIQVATIDTTANTINFIDSVVTGFDIVTDTTPQLGGTLDTNGNPINFGDNDKAQFGASQDLQIYHDGSNSYIKDSGTGDLLVEFSDDFVVRTTSSETCIRANENSSVDLYYDNAVKLATTSTGVDVTGVAVTDGLTSSSTVLIGKTSASTAIAGFIGYSTGAIASTRDGDSCIIANRLTSDGDIATFYKDGTEVGNISAFSGDIHIGTGSNNIRFTTADLRPCDGNGANSDDVVDLGDYDSKWHRLYLGGSALILEQTLTDGATISWDVSSKSVAKVTLGGNRTISAPSSVLGAGQFISLLVIQDGTGSRTLTWNAVYEFKDDTAPTLSTTASKGDLFVFRYNGTKWLEVGRNQNLTLA